MADQHDRELQVIDSVADAPPVKKFLAYAKISGPGWLQGAITLGGGSLAGALYLGVISGYGLMWLQPLAMICGIIMLCAIAYVTLSTQQRPFHSINRHLSPLLGWSWLIATIMANIVWVMPQFSLATGAITENLIPALNGNLPVTILIVILLFATGIFVNVLYQSEGKGAKIFDRIIKGMVGIIVLSFFAVVIALTTSGQLDWGKLFTGFLPNLSYLFEVAPGFKEMVAASSDPTGWADFIKDTQKDKIMAAFATAVGINMTFLLPYSLLKKKWGPKHRGLSIADLSIGLFIPFFLATACVVIASGSQFHAKTGDLLSPSGNYLNENSEKVVSSTLKKVGITTPNLADRQLGASLAERNHKTLAKTLKPAFGNDAVSQFVFGIGVVGMAVSTIIILMLMNGLAFQEAFSPRPAAIEVTPATPSKKLFYIGCVISGISGSIGPFIWGNPDAKAALAVPTSVIGGCLLPIAYFTFLLMMNSKKILGDARPEGKARIIWNTLMIFATTVATLASVWVLVGKTAKDDWSGTVATGGLIFLAALFIIGTLTFIRNEKRA